MQFSFKLYALIILITLGLVACVKKNSHMIEGIYSFRIQNYRQAFVHLKTEAMRGQPDAQYAVGYMYYYGEGVTENRPKAWYWINKAAQAKQPDALAALAILEKQPENIFP